MILDDEILVYELYDHCNKSQKAMLDFLVVKIKVADKNKPEKSKCPHCGKKFWLGAPMRAHQKAKGHTDAIIRWYQPFPVKKLYFERSLDLMQGVVNGQS